jgi:hypothetical protein
VSDQGLSFDPYLHDPAGWGVSMAQLTEIMLPCLDAAEARSVAEIGAYAGDLTRVLVAWANRADARVTAIDPTPQPGLELLADEQDRLELIRQTSLEALPGIALPDAIVIDGDHNYYTVSQELRLIAQRAGEGYLPLLLFHDVRWPHGRRDDYAAPEQIPPEARHGTIGDDGGISPGNSGVDPKGLPYPGSADHEGGPGNGVLTAIDDFVAGREHIRLVVVPAFFGLGVAWDTRCPFAPAVATLLDPFDRHPVLDRLETNRVAQIVAYHQLRTELWDVQQRLTRQRGVLERLLQSSAFALAERLSRFRAAARVAPEQSVVSKAEIRAALDEDH